MKVRILEQIGTGFGTIATPGQMVDLPPSQAERLVRAGFAEPVDEGGGSPLRGRIPERAILPPRGETAELPRRVGRSDPQKSVGPKRPGRGHK